MHQHYHPYFYRQTLDTYGAKGALNATSLSLPEILTYALQDEYLAQARYNRILGTYGYIRTFEVNSTLFHLLETRSSICHNEKGTCFSSKSKINMHKHIKGEK